MRTRNRGQRTSIVSSLGLCPRNRKAKCVKKLISKPRKNTRKLLSQRTKHAVEAFNRRSQRNRMQKGDAHDQKQPTLLQLFSAHQSQRRYSCPKLSLPDSISSSPKLRTPLGSGKDLVCKPAVSVESKESSRIRVSAVLRGRKRQFVKAGRPKIVRSTESVENTTKPSIASSRSRRSRATVDEDQSVEIKSATAEMILETSSSDTLQPSTTKQPRTYSRRAPPNPVKKIESNDTVIKRPRGRPRSSVNDKAKGYSNSNGQQKKRLIHFIPVSEVGFAKNDNTDTKETHFTTSITSPKSIQIDDLYYANELKFGAPDSVLQGLLKEVDSHGVVPQVSGYSDECISRKAEENVSPDAVFTFDVPVVERVFRDLWRSADKVLKLDTKDLFLALNGLLRPGIFELWRRRLDEQSKKLSRSHMGRLRPNPRPRRYSDMFVPGGGGQSVTGSRHPASDIAHFTEKARPGSRCVAIAAARLTAAKKLIRARTHHKRGPRVIANTAHAFVGTSSQADTESEDLDPKSQRKSRQTVSGTQLPIPRTRRRPDVSHHIDWKFCYAHSEKQNSSSISNTPKRRRRMEQSPDKTHVPLTILPPDTEEVGFTTDSPSASYDTDPPSANTREENALPVTDTDANTDVVKREVTDIADAHVLQMNQSLADRISFERSVDGRRKRRHALTVQRKRPVERPMSSFIESERLLWRTEHVADKTDPLSDSSATSISFNRPPNTYDRSFRHTKWIRPPTPKPKGNVDHSREVTSDGCLKPATRSMSLPRSRNIVGGLHARRSLKNSQLHSYVSHRSRISRRPDRMCQLTLLDRLVLGLNCSVAQNDDEIHVKRLHEDELTILTQRINKTGFSVHSLSVRKSANNDAEYNIVLTFSPNSDASLRRARCHSLTARSHLLDHGHSTERGPRESSTTWISKQKLKTRQSNRYTMDSRNASRKSPVQSALESILQQPESTQSLNSGYHSDTDVLTKKNRTRKLRRTRSDTDLLDVRSVAGEPSFLTGPRDFGSPSVPLHNGPFQPSEVNGGRHSPLVSSSSYQSSKDWLRPTPSSDRTASSLGERRFLPEAVTQKRGIQVSRSGSERQTYDTDMHSIASISSHGIPKRPLGIDTLASNHMTPFRRHSPRKVIRKVYTGSSTIPKILNRKRPTGSPSVNLSIPSCSAPPTSTILTLTHPIPSSVSSSSCTSTLPVSTCSSTVNSSIAPTIIFDEPTQALPVCPPAPVTGFSFQYRRFPAPVMPVTVVPTSAKLVDHSVNLTPTSSHSTLYSENRSPGVLRFRTVSSIPVGSSLTPVSVKTPDRIHLSDLSTLSLAARHPGTESPLSVRGDLGSELPVTESKGLNCKTSFENPTTTTITASSTGANLTTTIATEVKAAFPAATNVPSSHSFNGSTTTTATATANQMRSTELHPSTPSSVAHSMGSSTPDITNLASPDAATESANCENELPADLDGSYTPATSMSASQLLKLKRLHDEAGRSVTGPGGSVQLTESRTNPTPLYSTFPNRVQSPQTLPLQGKQAQSIHSEATDSSRFGKSSQFEPSAYECASQQQHHHHHNQQQQHPQCTQLSTHLQHVPGICSVSPAVIGSESHVATTATTTEPVNMDVVDEDADEFELRSIDHPASAVFYPSGGGNSQSFLSRESNPPSGIPLCCASAIMTSSASSDMVRLSATGAPRLQRLPWPAMRPTGQLSSFVAPGMARFHSGVCMARGTESGSPGTAVDSPTPDQITTRVVMQSSLPMGTTVIPASSSSSVSSTDSSASDQQRTLSCNPLSLPHASIMNAYDPSGQTLSVTTYNQSNSMPLSGVPLKRTIVHKYHSFRKILPKSPERLGNFVPTPTLHTISNVANASTNLTQLPVLGTSGSGPGAPPGAVRMYRTGTTGSFSQPSLLSCDSTGETAYFVDISTNLSDVTGPVVRATGHSSPFGLHAYTTTSTSTAGAMVNPASQLLKSLLESGDSKEAVSTVFTIPINQHPQSQPSGLRKSTPTVTSSTGTVTWNQPAHQSRGTWQLGKRVQSTASSRPTSDGSIHSRSVANTEPRDTSDPCPSDLSSTVKLTPGSKSRLQQLQQHYQRRQQLQQPQPKQQQSPPPRSPLPVDQSTHSQTN